MPTIDSPHPSTSTISPSRRAFRTATRAGAALGLTAAAVLVSTTAAHAADPEGPLANLTDTSIGSVVAPNGDQIPFSLAVAPVTSGMITKGDVLVAEYGDASGDPGAGTTILDVNPTTGTSKTFFSSPDITGPVGIALNPSNDAVWLGDYGTNESGQASNIAVITSAGQEVALYTPSNVDGETNIYGVWGQGVSVVNGVTSFYWGNAGNADEGFAGGDVWRVNPGGAPGSSTPLSSSFVKLASGQGETPAGGQPVGPQAFAYDQATGVLYESNDANNTIYALPGAATATSTVDSTVVSQGGDLDGPENLLMDPATGDLLVVNSGNDTLVDMTTSGDVLGVRTLVPGGQPFGLFGLALGTDASGNEVLYYTNDSDNTLHELTGLGQAAPPAALPEAPMAAALPLVGVALAGGFVLFRRRRAAA
jgi:hypothetical protein